MTAMAQERDGDGKSAVFPGWLGRARKLYERGFSTEEIAMAIPETSTRSAVHWWLKRAGVQMRPAGEGRRIQFERLADAGFRTAASAPAHVVDRWIRAGSDAHLDRGIARIEAQIADDMSRGGSAFDLR